MIKPLNNYVALVAIEEQEEVTASGIYLGTTNKAKQPVGRVVAIGTPMDYHSILRVREGDVVYYKNAIEIKDGNKDYILVKLEDFIAKRGSEE